MCALLYSPKAYFKNTRICNLAPAVSMASTSSAVKSGTFSTSRNSCIRDTLEVVLQFARSTKLEPLRRKRNVYSRNNNHVLGQDPLCQYLTCRNWLSTSLFEPLANRGKNRVKGTTLNAYDRRQAAVGLYGDAMLLTEFVGRLCSFVDIRMEFDLVER